MQDPPQMHFLLVLIEPQKRSLVKEWVMRFQQSHVNATIQS